MNDRAPRTRLDGLRRGGYQIVYTHSASAALRAEEAKSGNTDLQDSIGLSVANDGRILEVRWGSPVFQSGLLAGGTLVAVNRRAFATDILKAAVDATDHEPLTLEVKLGPDAQTVTVPWQGGLRYPHLERIPGPAILDSILAPK